MATAADGVTESNNFRRNTWYSAENVVINKYHMSIELPIHPSYLKYPDRKQWEGSTNCECFLFCSDNRCFNPFREGLEAEKSLKSIQLLPLH